MDQSNHLSQCLDILLDRESHSVCELARCLRVTQRSVYRYKEDLVGLGYNIVKSGKGRLSLLPREDEKIDRSILQSIGRRLCGKSGGNFCRDEENLPPEIIFRKFFETCRGNFHLLCEAAKGDKVSEVVFCLDESDPEKGFVEPSGVISPDRICVHLSEDRAREVGLCQIVSVR